MIVAVAYLHTGFDIINVPADPALLRSCASSTITFPTLDILNKRFLSSVRVKIDPRTYSEDLISTIDYVELKEENSNTDGVFYYVTSYAYTSMDVVTLSLVQDSILTCGGINIIKTIYAKRAHISKSADKFGAFDADDELLMPKEPLQIVHSGSNAQIESDIFTNPGYHNGAAGLFFKFMTGFDAQSTVVVSTVGLAYNGTDTYMNWSGGINMFGQWGITQGKPSDMRFPKIPIARGMSVILPNVFKYTDDLSSYSGGSNFSVGVKYSGLEYNELNAMYEGHDPKEALNILRAVGVEDSVIACYRLRSGEGRLETVEGSDSHLPTRLTGREYSYSTNGWGGGEGDLETSSSRDMAYSEAYDYDYLGAGIHNMRVLYGQFRKYVLASPATGSAIEAKPEELTARRFTADYISSATATGKNGAPTIFCFTDPRPTGRPYFNFVKFGQSPKTYGSQQAQRAVINLAEGAVAGGQWPEVPLTFTGMSGEWTARVGYNIDASYRDYLASPQKTYRDLMAGAAYDQNMANSAIEQDLMRNVPGQIVGSAAHFFAGGVDDASSTASGVVGLGSTVVGAYANSIANDMQYNAKMQNALLDVMKTSSFASVNAAYANEGNIAANRMLERQYAASYEKAKFDLSTSYSVPKLAFMSTDSMRDIMDNCAYYARYTPTKTDLIRMDNILQAFGYKVDMLMPNPISNRSKFVYMEGSVEKFNTDKGIRKDMMLDINNQLANGIRVWKVNPKNANVYDPGD